MTGKWKNQDLNLGQYGSKSCVILGYGDKSKAVR